MQKNDYLKLKSLIKEHKLNLVKPNYSIMALLFETTSLVGLYFLLLNVTLYSIAYFITCLFIGLVFFKFFCLLHEAGHNAAFPKKIHNTFYGLICSPFCLMPYISWREIHFKHHKWVGVIDKDPTQKDLLLLKNYSSLKKNIFRILWKLMIPIPAIKMFFSIFWINGFRNLKADKSLATKELGALVFCFAPHLILLSTLGLQTYFNFIFIPSLFLFFWFEVVNFTHHSGLFPFTSETREKPIPLYEQDTVTRTSSYPAWISTFFAYNFNFHTEHHYFPKAPWHNLPNIRKLIHSNKLDTSAYQDVPFLQYSVHLRKQNPIKLYIDTLPY